MIYTDPKFLDVIRALDELLVSENPTVRELMQQAILVQTMENPERGNPANTPTGPFESMFHQMQLLRAEVNALKHGSSYWSTNTTFDPIPYGGYSPGYGPTPPTSITISNISTMTSTMSTSTYVTDIQTMDSDIDWNAMFATIKIEADASDPKPAEDYYDPATEKVTATSAKLKEILEKLK